MKTVLEKLNGKVVVWVNEYFGEITQADKSIEEFKVIDDNQDKIVGMIRMTHRTTDAFGKDIETMIKDNLTFAEAQVAFHLLPRQ